MINWSIGPHTEWRKEELAKIPKKTITVICEYGSRRCLQGDPVLDHEGNVLRYRAYKMYNFIAFYTF